MDRKKVTGLIILAAFVLLMVGAGLLYSALGDQWAPDALQVQTPATQPTEAETSAPEPVGGTTAPTEGTTAATAPVQELPDAPDFTVYDADGKPVKLSDYFGKPIVLNFWASWCGPCQSEMPDFQAKYEELGQDVQFLMVNMTSGRETLESAKEFIENRGYTFPVLYDSGEEAAYAYSVYYLPTTYFINAQGKAVARATSAINAQMLQQGIDMITQEVA